MNKIFIFQGATTAVTCDPATTSGAPVSSNIGSTSTLPPIPPVLLTSPGIQDTSPASTESVSIGGSSSSTTEVGITGSGTTFGGISTGSEVTVTGITSVQTSAVTITNTISQEVTSSEPNTNEIPNGVVTSTVSVTLSEGNPKPTESGNGNTNSGTGSNEGSSEENGNNGNESDSGTSPTSGTGGGTGGSYGGVENDSEIESSEDDNSSNGDNGEGNELPSDNESENGNGSGSSTEISGSSGDTNAPGGTDTGTGGGSGGSYGSNRPVREVNDSAIGDNIVNGSSNVEPGHNETSGNSTSDEEGIGAGVSNATNEEDEESSDANAGAGTGDVNTTSGDQDDNDAGSDSDPNGQSGNRGSNPFWPWYNRRKFGQPWNGIPGFNTSRGSNVTNRSTGNGVPLPWHFPFPNAPWFVFQPQTISYPFYFQYGPNYRQFPTYSRPPYFHRPLPPYLNTHNHIHPHHHYYHNYRNVFPNSYWFPINRFSRGSLRRTSAPRHHHYPRPTMMGYSIDKVQKVVMRNGDDFEENSRKFRSGIEVISPTKATEKYETEDLSVSNENFEIEKTKDVYETINKLISNVSNFMNNLFDGKLLLIANSYYEMDKSGSNNKNNSWVSKRNIVSKKVTATSTSREEKFVQSTESSVLTRDGTGKSLTTDHVNDDSSSSRRRSIFFEDDPRELVCIQLERLIISVF